MPKKAEELGGYQQAHKKLRTRAASELDRIHRAAEEAQRRFVMLEAELAKHTAAYLESGICMLDAAFAGEYGALLCSEPRDYFKELAQELGRPFLLATEQENSSWSGGRWTKVKFIELRAPANARMKNVVSSLTLVARRDISMFDPSAIVIGDHTPRLWKFYFVGDPGREVFTSFCNLCRTDPIIRISLKL